MTTNSTAATVPDCRNANLSRPLILLQPRQQIAYKKSAIPEIRTGIRKQLKLLMAVSRALPVMGLFTECTLFLCAKLYQNLFEDSVALACFIMGTAFGIFSIFLFFCIRFSIWEITDELKKLNKEV